MKHVNSLSKGLVTGLTLDREQSDSQSQNQAMRSLFSDWFALGVTACFFAVDLLVTLHHEMWRDELESWLIARQSGSIFDLVKNMRYEGHPPLWFLLLFVVTRFTKWVTAMQLLNVVIATGTAYLIAARSPFSKLQKILLCFGYFPLYEFGVISRNYGIGLFLLVWFCASYRPDRKQNWIIPALLLSLLANTSVYGSIIAITFAASLFVFPAIIARDRREFLAEKASHPWTAALIFVACLAIAIIQMHPPTDISGDPIWHLHPTPQRLEKVLTAEWKAFVPLPGSLNRFWNTNFLDAKVRTMVLGSAMILLSTLVLLARKRLVLLAYGSATASILTCMLVISTGYERHFGHLFLAFIACLWISARLPEKPFALHSLGRASRLLSGQGQRILTCLLCVQFAAGALACWVDWRRPFSQAKAAAAFLRTNGMGDMFLVGEGAAAQSVAGYLDRAIYYIPSQSTGTFIVWNRNWRDVPRNPIEVATTIAKQRQEDVIVISEFRLRAETAPVHEVAKFEGSIAEDFYLYRVLPNP